MFISMVNALTTQAARAMSNPETEVAKDVWDLAVFGHSGTLDFTVIAQRWLREITKRWAAYDLPREVRTVPTRARSLGLTRPSAPAAGLGEDFALHRDDVPVEPEPGEPGRDLPTEIMRQLCAHLPRSSAWPSTNRVWVNTIPDLRTSDATEFDKRRIVLYAYRHCYTQRHADAGVPIDVLRQLMDHSKLDTTKQYYHLGETRRREAVGRVAAMQFDRHGNRVWRDAKALLDAEHARRAVGEVAVPFGVCAEPSNVKAGGAACPYRSAAQTATTSAPTCPTYPTCRHTSTTCCAPANASAPPPTSTPGPAPKPPHPTRKSPHPAADQPNQHRPRRPHQRRTRPHRQRRRQRVLTALNDAATRADDLTVTSIARTAGVDRTFLYRHRDTPHWTTSAPPRTRPPSTPMEPIVR